MQTIFSCYRTKATNIIKIGYSAWCKHLLVVVLFLRSECLDVFRKTASLFKAGSFLIKKSSKASVGDQARGFQGPL